MTRILFSAGLAATLTATTALAGGYTAPVVESDPVTIVSAPALSWDGAYVGVHMGYGSGSIEDVDNDQASKHDTSGLIGGVQAGYNWHLPNNLVLGVEAELSAMNIKESWVDKAYWGTDQHKWGATLRGRVGYAMDSFLPYLHGGFAWAKNEHSLGCGDGVHGTSCSKPFDDKKSHNVTGYVIGAGFEYAVDQNWSVRGEYAYTNYGKNKLYFDGEPGYTKDRNFKSDHHSVKLGVNYRF